MKDDHWDYLKTFLVLAQTENLSAAAKMLGTTHTTVLRRIKKFEQQQGVALFQSLPSGYVLTGAGSRLFEASRGIEEHMDRIFRMGQNLQPHTRVCITTTSSICQAGLICVLADLKQENPELDLELKISNRHYNLSKREADIAVRPSSDVPEHLIGTKLGEMQFAAYASQSYIDQHPGNPFEEAMEGHEFIGLDESLSHLRSKKWLDHWWHGRGPMTRCDSITGLGELCQAGFGIALLPQYFERVYRNLVKVHQPQPFLGSALWVLTHRDMAQNPLIKKCSQFIAQNLKARLGDFLS